MGKKIEQIKKEMLADEEFRREYDAMGEEFSIAAQLIEVRTCLHAPNIKKQPVPRLFAHLQIFKARPH